MFFSKNGFAAARSGDSLLELRPPIFEANGEEIAFEAADGCYRADGFEAADEVI